MGRKKLVQTELVQDAPLNNEALSLAQSVAALASEVGEERDLVNQLLGQAQMADSFAKFSKTVFISKLAFVKENKLYRALQGGRGEDGLQFSGTWDEFCNLLGWVPQHANEAIANLRQFGEEALESMSRMGIGYRELRQYRRLPEDQKTALLEAAKAGDKESFVELAEELISKHAKEKEALEARLKDVQEDYEALGSVCATHSKRADELQVAQEILKRKIQTQPASEHSTQLLSEAAQIGIKYDLGLRGDLRAAFTQLEKDAEACSLDHRNFMAGVVRELEITLAAIRSEFNLPDSADQNFSLLSHVEGMPEWMTHEQ
ncbi:hypothetical protein [Pseudomonas nitroreducens]|uniref:hypothetical protein n=1 Tax=Pseudomonas nitroreducens TaxID=46680 RepID=UPI003CC825F6